MFNKRKIATYAVIIELVSIVFGIILANINRNIESNIIDNIGNNYLYLHICVTILLLILNLSYLGFIGSSIYISIDGVSTGYIIFNILKNYKINGIIFYLLYYLIFKLPFILILVYILYISYRYNQICFNNINNKRNDYFKSITKYIFYKYIIIFSSIFIYDGILFIFGNKIINLLKDML